MAADLDVSRVEEKYMLTYSQAENVHQKLREILPGDTFNGYEPYTVRSLYFDSYFNDDYYDKLAGIKDRKKIRLRIYDSNSQTAKLELKQKEGANQRKRSLTVTRDEAVKMCNGDYEFLAQKDDELAQTIYFIMKKEVYRPKCIVEYKRRAFAVPTNDIRITLDSEIVSSEGNMNLFDADMSLVPVESRNNVILEVKYNHFLLSYVKDALRVCEVTQESYSKYIAARKYGLS